jgi:hypothetical protein
MFAIVRLTEEGHDWEFFGDYYDDVDDARDAAAELAQYSPGTTYEVVSMASIATFIANPEDVVVEVEETEDDAAE